MMSTCSAGRVIAAAASPPAGWVADQLRAKAFGFTGELETLVEELTFAACVRVGRFDAAGADMANMLLSLANSLPATDERGRMVHHALTALSELHRLRGAVSDEADKGAFLVFDIQRGLAEIGLTRALQLSEKAASVR